MRQKLFVSLLLMLLTLFECQCTSTATRKEAQRETDVALFKAAEAGNLAAVKELVAKGANVNCHGQQGLTPLHNAVYNGNVELAEFLIAKGADVNAKSWNGRT
ncbi:MAG: ankyrin repeat domain-containing protein, partial [Planctomycetes bacterium]|nr:ankyrin repeat domain-containing protein [Planctomycetota bacterium]